MGSWFVRERDLVADLGLQAPRRTGEGDCARIFAEAASSAGATPRDVKLQGAFFLLEEAGLPEERKAVEALSEEALTTLIAAIAAKLHVARAERCDVLQRAAEFGAETIKSTKPKGGGGTGTKSAKPPLAPKADNADDDSKADDDSVSEVSDSSPSPARPVAKKQPTKKKAGPRAESDAKDERIRRLEAAMKEMVAERQAERRNTKKSSKSSTSSLSSGESDRISNTGSDGTEDETPEGSLLDENVWTDPDKLFTMIRTAGDVATAEASFSAYFSTQLASTGADGYVARDLQRMWALALRMMLNGSVEQSGEWTAMLKVMLQRMLVYKMLSDGADTAFVSEFSRSVVGAGSAGWVKSAMKDAKVRTQALTARPSAPRPPAANSGPAKSRQKRNKGKKSAEKRQEN